MKKTLKITDLDFNFRAHPVTGNLLLKSGADVIKQSLKTLILLNMFEKPFFVLSGNITNQLFEDMNYANEFVFRERILTLLRKYEPRIDVTDVLLKQTDQNVLNMTIIYTIIGEDVPQEELSIEVTSRTR